jgi:ArsR family transcriptional regulator, arsenate/arsenite/antimonite-responsive transcriptional repressor
MAPTMVSQCPSDAAGFKAPDAMSVRGSDMKVELDKRSLFALASDTRLEMLKALQSNRRTVSQLAELLGIDKAAVHRHLKKLEEGSFVVRTEDHGFVYYALTWKSRDILNPNDRTKIVILISSALVCLLAMAVVVFMASYPAPLVSQNTEQASDAQDGGEKTVPDSSAPAPAPSSPVPLAALGLASATLAALAWRQWRRPRQKGGETASDAPAHVEPADHVAS